jgi:ATP-dependent DNA helicase RecG
VVNTSYRPKAYEFIRNQVEQGHQVYVICPLVEESEGLDAENVVDYTQMLAARLPGIAVACLHGKMKGTLKNQIMEEFAAGHTQVLVSTTVIEVGVNVPNATVMMIEDAQRFGLAQLHQLRGRVGRGDAQSYCIMINTADNEKAKKRLEILNKSNDGFFIASEDLKLRGPGDFFGIRQSGLLQFRLGDIYQDGDILTAASQEAKKVLADDPKLESDAYSSIGRQVIAYMDAFGETMNL